MSVVTNSLTLNKEYLMDLFNINATNVQEITITNRQSEIYCNITLLRKKLKCPVCSTETDKIKDYTTKKIIHSLTTHMPCYINYRARRYVCPVCKKTFYEDNPFSYSKMKLSSLTVCNVLNDLKKANETYSSVSSRYNISNTAVTYIFDQHVNISRLVLPKYLLIDEVYAMTNYENNYVCILVDFKTGRTVDLLATRKKTDLLNYFRSIPRKEREQVKVVSMDMWSTYKNVANAVFPNAKCSVDRFHIYQELNRRIQAIRIETMNKIKPPRTKNQDPTKKAEYIDRDNKYYILKKFNWLLVKNHNHLKDFEMWDGKIKKTYYLDCNIKKKMNRKLKTYLNYYDINEIMMNIETDLTVAMNLKYDIDMFFKKCSIETARKELEEIIKSYRATGINEIVSFTNTLINWKNEIINSFIESDEKKHIHNGTIEQRNKVIKQLKHNSNGFKNFIRFRNRALYVLNDNATYYLNPINKKSKT